MEILTNTLKDKIKQHALQEFPKECCGVVVLFKGKKKYIPCANIHPQSDKEFVLSPDDLLKAYELGEVVAIVHSHSHPESDRFPSKYDLIAQAESELTWIMYNINYKEFHEWSDGVKPSLYGREYKHGIVDCLSFIRDWYREELGIHINNYHREDDWWHKGQNLYLDNYEKEGFYKIPFSETRYGDLLLMNIGGSVVNHSAVYIGENKVAHHATNRLSCVDVYGSFLRDRTVMVLRHRDMEDRDVKND